MPIDFQQITHKIREIGAGAGERRERLAHLRSHARDLIDRHGEQLDYLHTIVEQARGADPNTRCASPVAEPLTAHHPAPENTLPGALPVEATLIAADGSQVNPDRHAAVQFGLINVGAIIMHKNPESSPDIHTNSELLYGDELETTFGTVSEGMIALRRDLKERNQLVELSAQFEAPIVTFTDGPIELWGAGDAGQANAYLESLARYKSVLSQLQERGVITAGYVDKPSANLVLRLLELVDAQKDQPSSLREYHPLRGISDRWLFGEKTRPMLGPGERSAVFAIRSKSEKDYQGVLALHFFYLNVGTQGHPWPVRVEIPGWVAEDIQKLELLHAVLVEQCRIMGSKPYPYLLHRAHEVAVVKQEEKYQIEQMLIHELHRQDEELDEISSKGSAKSLKGRTRR